MIKRPKARGFIKSKPPTKPTPPTISPLIKQPEPGKTFLLALKNLDLTRGVQLRARLDTGVVEEYAEIYRSQGFKALPPVKVFLAKGDALSLAILADGFHRIAAARQAGLKELEAFSQVGDRRDAILYAASANSSHGLRLTNADKVKIVTTILADKEWGKWSDREISRRLVVVSPNFVGKHRPAGTATAKRTGKDGIERAPRNSRTAAKSGSSTIDPVVPVDVVRKVEAAIAAVPGVLGAGMHPVKRHILAICQLASSGPVERQLLAATLQSAGMPDALDVHPGHLVQAGLLNRTDGMQYALTPAGHRVVDAALAAQRQPPKSATQETGKEPPELGPKDVQDPPEQPSAPPTAPKPAPAQKKTPLAERRATWIRTHLAEHLERLPPYRGSGSEMAALVLIIGVAGEAKWSESFVQGALTKLHDEVASTLATELRFQTPSRFLPDWQLIAKWWGENPDAIRILAERAVTE